MPEQRIGLIGLGKMGHGIGRNLLRKGYSLTVYDVDPEAVARLAALGAAAAPSPRQVAAQSDIVVTVLPDGPDVERVVLGPDGVTSGMKPGTIVLDCSTIDPEVTRRVGAALRAGGGGMVDAGMGGLPTAAEEGTLFFMVGATPEDLERVRPLLEAMGKQILHCGGPGAGMSMKLINNLLALSVLAADLEALAMGVQAGLTPEVMLQALRSTFADNKPLHTLVPDKILKGDHAPGFKVALAAKDAGLAVAYASSLRVPIWTMGQVRHLLSHILAQGKGEQAHTVLATAFEEITGRRFSEWK
jgi:3-hydroxyisobutyrate dehydrogenase-like beta-hydroxyacid dehydrogenase